MEKEVGEGEDPLAADHLDGAHGREAGVMADRTADPLQQQLAAVGDGRPTEAVAVRALGAVAPAVPVPVAVTTPPPEPSSNPRAGAGREGA